MVAAVAVLGILALLASACIIRAIQEDTIWDDERET